MAQSSDAALEALLQRHCEAFLHRSPEEATGANFDIGANAALRSRLDDRSLDARAGDRAAVARALRELRAVPTAGLSPRAALDRDVALYVYETLERLLGFYGYADINLRPSPYVVSQMNGAYYWLPDFIGSRHPIADAADAQAWFDRLGAFAVALDQESERIRHDAGIGVVPPDFVITKTIAQVKGLRDRPPLESALLAPALRKLAALGREGDAQRALEIFNERIAPALTRQIEALEAVLPQAVSTAGVWRLPDGEAYYASAVQSNTTTDIDPGELHKLGLDQCASLISQIDTLLKAEGMSRGTVGERIKELNNDPRFKVSDDDAGREKLLELARGYISDITARLPQAYGIATVDPIEVRRIPPAIEAGAPGAFYSEGAEGEPGIYSLNLHHPGEHSLWRLPTLTHHEAVPGHHFQYSVLSHAPSLPLFRRVVRFSAYTEGYALYAQQVAAELGIFDGQPFNRIGELQSQLFRAARIVVDTGLHHERWTKDQAIAWMVENAGEQPLATEREVTRYAVYPGQACSFKVGATRIVAAREAARQAMGPRFDVRQFHDLILTSGPMPMAVLEKAVAQWASGTI
ncbi:DUF885 domain-containing protein [Novosphingobium sp. PC22D]|uniref:DUF885 domain-containing protein n=1 Tax=Novosphingobium sp. PC22D TaxID=1962403 RepID=UPI001F0AF204|nr:DUF885 domain-containing protein [Novosphingobium sp. PC22D]